MDEAQLGKIGNSEDVRREQEKEVNCKQKKQQFGSIE